MKIFCSCPECGRWVDGTPWRVGTCDVCHVKAHRSGLLLFLCAFVLLLCVYRLVDVLGFDAGVLPAAILIWPAFLCVIVGIVRIGKQLVLAARRRRKPSEPRESP